MVKTKLIKALIKTDFTSLLKNPKEIKNQDTINLKSVIEEYPYFQSARALFLKGLKNQESFKYNNELKTTAAYTTDRLVLFNFITSNVFIKKNVLSLTKEKQLNNPPKNNEKIVANKPFSFNQNETFSFNQWLQLSEKKIIKRTEKEEKATSKNILIERFIQNNPKITPVDKSVSVEISIKENIQQSQLMTETLAKVYLEQKKYENAIQAYRILSLKYPEKSGFFADQIKRIQIITK